jgi:hypothetical protein
MAVESHAERDQEDRKGEEVDAGEQPQVRGAEAELGGDLRPEQRVDRTKCIRDVVAGDKRQEDAQREVQLFGVSRPPR